MGTGLTLDGGALVGRDITGDFFIHLGFYECDKDGGGGTTAGPGVLTEFHPFNTPGKIKFEGCEYRHGHQAEGSATAQYGGSQAAGRQLSLE